jgi:hypothetical protein
LFRSNDYSENRSNEDYAYGNLSSRLWWYENGEFQERES